MPKVWISDTDEEVEFEGREVEVWEGMPGESPMDTNDQFSMTIRLYECPDGYRVHETIWALSPGRSNTYTLYPPAGDMGYGTYTEEGAREKWGGYFRHLSGAH